MRRASVTCALLAALAALALLASAAPDPHSSCTKLAAKYQKYTLELGNRSVSVDGRPVSVTLYWGSDPARAAAALLRAALRDVLGYQGVQLAQGPLSTAELARFVPFRSDAQYTKLAIGISTAWTPETSRHWDPTRGELSGLAGPRLSEFGRSPVPARCRLFAQLTPAMRELCHPYADMTALALCGFDKASHQDNQTTLDVTVVDACNSTLPKLQARATHAGITLTMNPVNRTGLFSILHTAKSENYSLFFIDFDIWEGEETVSAVNPPLCTSNGSSCAWELDPIYELRVADVEYLQTYAPQFFRFVYSFTPTVTSLRQILKREALDQLHIDEAACEWAINNESYLTSFNDKKIYYATNLTFAIFICSDDPHFNMYTNFAAKILGHETFKEMAKNVTVPCVIVIRKFPINCTDTYDMSKKLEELTTHVELYRLLGVVSLAVEGAAAASAKAAASGLPLLLASVAPEYDAAANDATWRVAGRPQHVARALHHFVRQSGWTRLAVLSQSTQLSTDYYNAFEHNTTIIHRQFPIPLHLTKPQAQEALQRLRAAKARIVFINADSEAAVAILAAAIEYGMTYKDGFVWIVREWKRERKPHNETCNAKHFSLSLSTRGAEDIPPGKGRASLQNNLSRFFSGRPWPPHTVALTNAMLILANGFKHVFRRYPNSRNDLHSPQVIRSLYNSIIENTTTGVNQRLQFRNRSIEETFVFVDQWCGGQFEQRLARWRVNASSGAVRGNYTRPADLPQDDGTSSCTLRSGDEFDPDCHDAACACLLLLLVLASAALLLARRILRRRLARLKQEQQIQVIARRRHVATVLAAYLVEREALELREELGAGRFGSVRLARLRTSAHHTRYIAAKALRDNAAPAEESEFLREACTIASLDHAHIVRLVGVCIADGPPLVLMELAFFGDLLGYLRARRHLVEGVGTEALTASGEAEHVSAAALTRLAREAAEALQYLGVRGVVHRDVRAANCLVDVRRSLKLADFGMARDTEAGADGQPEYACRRRGLFPVLWMAPESLAHGVFSVASDMWAFGVLVLELVTLGARPYGAMSPLCVLEYVAAGGSPPLPLDASPQTRGLARLCWQRAAERRPSAAELAAYLAAWPLALRPALLTERDEPADADSGIGESPSTELLPPDSPLLSLDQLNVLGVTH